jgi:hypothetical protein
MSNEKMAARIIELEALLAVAIDEHRRTQLDIARAYVTLEELGAYLKPDEAREAIRGAMACEGGDSALIHCDDEDPAWKHVVPTYKVSEVVEYAKRCLRGDS